MTIKKRYDEAVGLLRLLRHQSQSSCDVIFVSPAWKLKHATHSHVISLASIKLAEDLIRLRKISDEQKRESEAVGTQTKELVIDVPGDVCEEGRSYLMSR